MLRVVALAVLVGMLGACGSSQGADVPSETAAAPATQPALWKRGYERELERIGAPLAGVRTTLDEVVGAILAEPTGTIEDPAEKARRLSDASETVVDVVGRLETLEPPKDVAQEHESLVLHFREFAEGFALLAAGTRADDAATFDRGLDILFDVGGKLDAEVARIEERGYRIPRTIKASDD